MKHNSRLTTLAQNLRKNMTLEERHLWYDCLKLLPIMVHRQKVMGHYIVDFYIAEAKIVIEVDGSQHYEPAGREASSHKAFSLRRRWPIGPDVVICEAACEFAVMRSLSKVTAAPHISQLR